MKPHIKKHLSIRAALGRRESWVCFLRDPESMLGWRGPWVYGRTPKQAFDNWKRRTTVK